MRPHRHASFVFTLGLALTFVTAFRPVSAQTPTSSPGHVTTPAEAITRARALVQKEFASKVPGLSVAVGVDGEIVWSEGFGYADLAEKIAVTPSTRFRIGSISKPIATAGLALLVERGRLDLDAPVQTYVPDFPVKGPPITTRQLAGHLSGIRHYRGRETLANRPYANVRAGLKIFEDDPLEAPPGTRYIYSTYGYSVLSAAMESAAAQEFTTFIATDVLRPLGMKDTRADRAGVTDPQRTQFYESNAAGAFVVAPTVDSSYKWAGGGYLSTPDDLVRFGSAHLQPGFLKAATLALVFTPQKTADGKSTDYGLGWRILRDARGHRVLLHTGGSVGGSSVLVLYPDSKVVLALVCNHSKTPFTPAAREAIADLFAPLHLPATRKP